MSKILKVDTVDSDEKFKDFFYNRLKSPLAIIGLAIVVFTIIVAIFPQVLTPLTLEQATGIYPGSWDPPSATHPLGQSRFGRDVLALLAYGVSTLIIVCILPSLIGIVIGILFVYIFKVHRWVKGLVVRFIIALLIIPSVLVLLIFLSILGSNVSVIMGIIAMFMILGVTFLISKGNYSLNLTVMKLISYFPLLMIFNILLFEVRGFFGFSDPLIVQLGNNISDARSYLYIAPFASLWPSLAIFAVVGGFLILHFGLKEPIPIISR